MTDTNDIDNTKMMIGNVNVDQIIEIIQNKNIEIVNKSYRKPNSIYGLNGKKDHNTKDIKFFEVSKDSNILPLVTDNVNRQTEYNINQDNISLCDDPIHQIEDSHETNVTFHNETCNISKEKMYKGSSKSYFDQTYLLQELKHSVFQEKEDDSKICSGKNDSLYSNMYILI
ncbi:hypothetical protein FQA39_LY18323 [Lamprigera yunnana]|nr:hypothetical protein FQA39_LY18323 [Lamprigera yunnana]